MKGMRDTSHSLDWDHSVDTAKSPQGIKQTILHRSLTEWKSKEIALVNFKKYTLIDDWAKAFVLLVSGSSHVCGKC